MEQVVIYIDISLRSSLIIHSLSHHFNQLLSLINWQSVKLLGYLTDQVVIVTLDWTESRIALIAISWSYAWTTFSLASKWVELVIFLWVFIKFTSNIGIRLDKGCVKVGWFWNHCCFFYDGSHLETVIAMIKSITIATILSPFCETLFIEFRLILKLLLLSNNLIRDQVIKLSILGAIREILLIIQFLDHWYGGHIFVNLYRRGA